MLLQPYLVWYEKELIVTDVSKSLSCIMDVTQSCHCLNDSSPQFWGRNDNQRRKVLIDGILICLNKLNKQTILFHNWFYLIQYISAWYLYFALSHYRVSVYCQTLMIMESFECCERCECKLVCEWKQEEAVSWKRQTAGFFLSVRLMTSAVTSPSQTDTDHWPGHPGLSTQHNYHTYPFT